MVPCPISRRPIHRSPRTQTVGDARHSRPSTYQTVSHPFIPVFMDGNITGQNANHFAALKTVSCEPTCPMHPKSPQCPSCSPTSHPAHHVSVPFMLPHSGISCDARHTPHARPSPVTRRRPRTSRSMMVLTLLYPRRGPRIPSIHRLPTSPRPSRERGQRPHRVASVHGWRLCNKVASPERSSRITIPSCSQQQVPEHLVDPSHIARRMATRLPSAGSSDKSFFPANPIGPRDWAFEVGLFAATSDRPLRHHVLSSGLHSWPAPPMFRVLFARPSRVQTPCPSHTAQPPSTMSCRVRSLRR
jgi:hypothetical protein